MENKGVRVTAAILRYILGIQLLWAFFDKLIGLGFATEPGKGWIDGGSPTVGFLQFGAAGPLAPLYNAIGGSGVSDWLFMLALLLIGLALILGITMKIATISGAVLMFLMWSAVLPKEHNIFFIDEHIVYLVVFLLMYFVKAGQTAGLGRLWAKTRLVQKAPGLE